MGKQNHSNRKIVYRLTLSDNESHEVIYKTAFTKARLIFLTISVLIVVSILYYLLLGLTPAKHMIPGYPNANLKKEVVETSIKVDSLETMLLRWELYAENLSRVLSGDKTISFDSLIRQADARYLSDKNKDDLARQDSLLRETVMAEEKYGFAQNPPSKKLPIEGLVFFTPAKGVIMADYDVVLHPGVDIKVSSGAVVSSVLDGTVIFTDREDDNGYIIVVQHADNLISIYHNTRKLLKGVGDKVKAGDPLALAGLREPYHLHFELWQNGETLNPTKFINFQ